MPEVPELAPAPTMDGSAPGGPEGTTAPAPAQVADGQAQDAQTQATGQPGPADAEERFFDPKDIADKPELMAAYKQMQAAFTKKSQDIKAHRQKIDAYDAFSRDPIGSLQSMAARMGFSLTRAEAAAVANQQTPTTQDFDPRSWDDVFAEAEKRAEARVMQRFAPLLNQVRDLKQQTIEQQLDGISPDWRTYESEMSTLLQEHPTLASHPEMLYRLAVPANVLEGRAAQAAIKKLQDKAASAQAAGASTTSKSQAAVIPDKPLSFQEAVEFAKKDLAAKGMRVPA